MTVVDAYHVTQHLDEDKGEGIVNEAVEQIAYADRILLNKVDLVGHEMGREGERVRGGGADCICIPHSAEQGRSGARKRGRWGEGEEGKGVGHGPCAQHPAPSKP